MKQNHSEQNGTPNKVLAFFKKNIYFILMIACILAIGTMITVAAVVNANRDDDVPVINTPDPDDKPKPDPDPDPDPEPEKPFVFLMQSPLAEYTVDLAFSDTELVFLPTQGHWAIHPAVDMTAPAGTQVVCGFDGEVTAVSQDTFWGGTVTVKHEGGYVSTYRLLDDVSVSVGDKVTQGQVIGVISGDALAETAQGAHLHLELIKDGVAVDPMQYLPEGDK